MKSKKNPWEITLVCRKGFGKLLLELRLVDQVYEIKKGHRESYQTALVDLSREKFDLLLCPHESVRSALFSFQIAATEKIGFERWWNRVFFSRRIVKDASLPESLRQMSLLSDTDFELKKSISEFARNELDWVSQGHETLSPVPAWASPEVSIPTPFPELASKYGIAEKFVCLFPGSVWKTKQWTELGFTQIGKACIAEGLQVLIMGGPGEELLTQRIHQTMGPALNLTAQTSLNESLAILARAQLVITNDSAGQHLAALAKTPTVSIFGPTVLDFGFRPWSSRAIVVENRELSCRPCGMHGHHRCPIGTHECMESIKADKVMEKVRLLLSQP
jgi:heptosyltransferase-2